MRPRAGGGAARAPGLTGEGKLTESDEPATLQFPHGGFARGFSGGGAEGRPPLPAHCRVFPQFRFEVAGEALEAVPEVKILCNSDLDAADLMAAGERRS